MDNKKPQKEKEHIIVLSSQIYKIIESKLPKPFVGSNTTEIEAGFLLGVQAVLRILRENHTVVEV